MMKKWQEWHKRKLIVNRYHIQETLGRENVAITYLAFDENAKNQVVIKTINPELLNQLNESEIKKIQDKFWEQAVRLSQCKHNHIVTFLDAFKDRETSLVYIIMEYIDGQSLASYRKILSQKEALKYIQQIGDALNYLHNKNIIHCNIKPSNIILQNIYPRKAVLIGFSLARSFNHPLTQITSDSADGFTPIELFSQEYGIGAFTDIYSLSATFYFLLTKKVPPSVKQRILSSRTDNKSKSDLVEPKEIIVTLSDRVNQAIIKGMAITPTKRFYSVEEWFRGLGLRHCILKRWHDKWQLLVNRLEQINPIITIVSIIVGIITIILFFM